MWHACKITSTTPSILYSSIILPILSNLLGLGDIQEHPIDKYFSANASKTSLSSSTKRSLALETVQFSKATT